MRTILVVLAFITIWSALIIASQNARQQPVANAYAASVAMTPLPTRTPMATPTPKHPTATPFSPCTTPTVFYTDNVKSISQCGAVVTAQFNLANATPFAVPTFPSGWRPCGASGQGLDAATANVQSWECVDGSENNVGVYYLAVAYNDYLDFQPTPTTTAGP